MTLESLSIDAGIAMILVMEFWVFSFSFVLTYTHFEFDVIKPYELLCSNTRFSAVEMPWSWYLRNEQSEAWWDQKDPLTRYRFSLAYILAAEQKLERKRSGMDSALCCGGYYGLLAFPKRGVRPGGRGGCCGRGCGSCEKTQRTHRDVNRGYCTSACGCCIRSRANFKDDGQAKRSDVEIFPFDIVSNKTGYYGRIFRAYVWV